MPTRRMPARRTTSKTNASMTNASKTNASTTNAGKTNASTTNHQQDKCQHKRQHNRHGSQQQEHDNTTRTKHDKGHTSTQRIPTNASTRTALWMNTTPAQRTPHPHNERHTSMTKGSDESIIT